jgi:hypothetical protein
LREMFRREAWRYRVWTVGGWPFFGAKY